MKNLLMNRINGIVSLSVLIFGFLLIYSETGEILGSLVAAILSAALVWMAIVIVGWIYQSL